MPNPPPDPSEEAAAHPAICVIDELIDALEFARESGVKRIPVDPVVWREFVSPRKQAQVQQATAQVVAASQSTDSNIPSHDAAALSTLNSAIESCEKCPLHKTCTKRLVGQGNSQSPDIMLINGMTSHADILAGQIISGAAGQLLDKMLAAIGQSRQSVYLTSACKCATQTGRQDPVAQETCAALLQREIAAVNPKIIIMLGPVAVKGTFANSSAGLCDTIGNWHHWQNKILAVAIHHPMRMQILPEATAHPLKADTWQTLLAVKRKLTNG